MTDNFIKIPEFENRSCDDIRKEIEGFKKDFFHKNISFDKIKNEIKKLGLGYRKENYYWFRFKEGLYRARRHEKEWKKKLFEKTGELWYRDWTKTEKLEHRYGRLNHPGENFMYLSLSRNASILEIRPEEGDWITVAQIVPLDTNKKLNLSLIAEEYMRKASEDLRQIIGEPNMGKRKLDEVIFKKLRLVDDFLIDIFTDHVDEEYKYKTSVAIWEYLRELNPNLENDGIMYPSIAFNYDAVNVGLFPKIVDSNYGIDRLITFEVYSVKYLDDHVKMSIHPVKTGQSWIISPNSVQINWKNPTKEEVDEYSANIEYEYKT